MAKKTKNGARKVVRPTAKQMKARAKFPDLFAWSRAAQRHGRVYYRCEVSRSGMQAKVLLWTIRRDRQTFNRGPWLDVAWPDDGVSVAGFCLRRRSFVVGGCGFDRVDHVLANIFWTFGLDRSAIRCDQLNRPE